MLKSSGSFDGLSLYVTSYSVDGNLGKRTELVFFAICILGNVIQFAVNLAVLVLTSAVVGFKYALLAKMTGSLYAGMADHFVNNTFYLLLSSCAINESFSDATEISFVATLNLSASPAICLSAIRICSLAIACWEIIVSQNHCSSNFFL